MSIGVVSATPERGVYLVAGMEGRGRGGRGQEGEACSVLTSEDSCCCPLALAGLARCLL